MQRVEAPVVGHGEAGRARGLRRDLAAEEARAPDVVVRVLPTEDVAVELLDVEHLQELLDVARLGLAELDRLRGLVHAGNRRPAPRSD